MVEIIRIIPQGMIDMIEYNLFTNAIHSNNILHKIIYHKLHSKEKVSLEVGRKTLELTSSQTTIEQQKPPHPHYHHFKKSVSSQWRGV